MKKKLSIVGICSGCVVIALVFTMINTAIPAISTSMGASIGSMQWMMTIFGIINCAMLVTAGRLADIYGRKKVYLVGLLFCEIAMFFGGFCRTPEQLFFCMAFAGLGNAILLPVSQALLVSEFPEEQRGKAIGLWASAIACAMAAGPVWGGILSGKWGWPWVFWSNAPVVAVSSFLVFSFSKESKNTQDPPLLDRKGVFYLTLSLASFVLVVTECRHLFWPVSLILLVVSVLGFFLLWKHEKRCSHPIILAELVGNRMFLAASFASSCLIFYLWALFFLLPLYLQNIRGQSALECGFTLMAITIPVAIFSPLIGRLYRVQTAGVWVLVGFLLLCASCCVQMAFTPFSSLATVLVAACLFGIGYSCILSPTATAAVSIISKEKAGIASGTFITIQEIGGTLGLALIVTLVRYYAELQEGYRQGMMALLCIGALGCVSSLFMLNPLPLLFSRD